MLDLEKFATKASLFGSKIENGNRVYPDKSCELLGVTYQTPFDKAVARHARRTGKIIELKQLKTSEEEMRVDLPRVSGTLPEVIQNEERRITALVDAATIFESQYRGVDPATKEDLVVSILGMETLFSNPRREHEAKVRAGDFILNGASLYNPEADTDKIDAIRKELEAMVWLT